MKKYFILGLALCSFSSFAQQTIEFEGAAGVANGDKTITTAHMEYEVVETGDPLNPINWDATVGIIDASEKTGRSILRDQNEDFATFDPVKGDAIFGTVGIQGRKFIVKDLIEATLRAEYGFRLHDNDPSYRELYGKDYDAYSGLNLSAGTAFILDKKYSLGGTVTRNMESGTTTVRIGLGFKFNRRNDR